MQIRAGEIIKAREEFNISLVDFARQVGISPDTFHSSKRTNPSLEVMMNIAQNWT